MKEQMTLNDAINWLLSKREMSPKKLQKMLYYAYSWGLVFLNDSRDKLENTMFNAEFEAWVHGPVIRDVYVNYAVYGFNDIEKSTRETKKLPEDVEDILNQVFEVYGDFNGNELEAITHSEEPWKEARGNLRPMDSSSTIIEPSTIFKFYTDMVSQD